MRVQRWRFWVFVVCWFAIPAPQQPAHSQSNLPPNLADTETTAVCPAPALSRLQRHTIAAGETVESIAKQYNLIPATVMGLNPSLQKGSVPVGTTIFIPPYNGIRVETPAGWTWQKLAEAYKVRADVLFEVNGCQAKPEVVFVPGVNWTPGRPVSPAVALLQGYPLPNATAEALGYGWQLHPVRGQVFFHSGIDLLAPVGTPVRAVGQGIVAYAGPQGNYGNLVVVNHQAGKQTRYAHLETVTAKIGQRVRPGEVLGTVGTTGRPDLQSAHLHFEIRYNSPLGWVAEDPEPYVQAAIRR